MNLNDKDDFSIENTALLISSKDDSINRQLRVTKGGIAFLSDDVGNINTDNLAFRFETWCRGNGYCGEEASKDSEWVRTVYNWLNDNWPNPKSDIIDY
ncbi:hypothetical protein [Photobacterium leiognathi]|uniref:hypothetical protein n=1 Tax=Photobacterium leiognathi TaxID=553611 RepID=UPI0029829E14|nr:hypothetical protein [Photobacterium leiognathi]